MSNFWQRAITGVFFVAIIVGAVWYGPVSAFVLISLVALLGTHEFIKLYKTEFKLGYVGPLMLSVSILSGVELLVQSGFNDFKAFFVTIPIVIGIMLIEIFKEGNRPSEKAALGVFASVYTALPFAMLFLLGYYPNWGAGSYEFDLILGMFILVWTSDTGAYIVGRAIGKNKLIERVSPGKTIEGFLGGVFFSMLMGYGLSHWLPLIDSTDWIVCAGIVGLFGPLGDLFQSRYKRALGVKDSGNILPGHGGILDRFDALLFAVPMVFTYLMLIG